jgi:hypothetical protein
MEEAIKESFEKETEKLTKIFEKKIYELKVKLTKSKREEVK